MLAPILCKVSSNISEAASTDWEDATANSKANVASKDLTWI